MPIFTVYCGSALVGHTELENGDPPMGVAFGRFIPVEAYRAIRKQCIESHSDQSALNLTVKTPGNETIQCAGVGILDYSEEVGEEGIEINVLGISLPPYDELFPHHVANYEQRFAPLPPSTNMLAPCSISTNSLLNAHRLRGAFTDCYATSVDGSVSLAEFVFAFYTTPLFKLERWLLARALGLASSDAQALQLARAEVERFSAWTVEARSVGQILLEAGPTRSWLSVEVHAGPQPATTLRFGSAVLPTRPGGKLGWVFQALLGFHRLYSRLLLAAARRRVVALRSLSRPPD